MWCLVHLTTHNNFTFWTPSLTFSLLQIPMFQKFASYAEPVPCPIPFNMMLNWSWLPSRPCFYQNRSAWSADQGSNKNHSPAYNFAPTVIKFCVMWEGQALPHHTKFGNCRYKIVDSRAFLSWSLIHGLRWSGLIKAEPVSTYSPQSQYTFHLLLGHQGLHDIHGYAWSHQPWSPRGYQWGDPDIVCHTLPKKSSPPHTTIKIYLCGVQNLYIEAHHGNPLVSAHSQALDKLTLVLWEGVCWV